MLVVAAGDATAGVEGGGEIAGGEARRRDIASRTSFLYVELPEIKRYMLSTAPLAASLTECAFDVSGK